MKCEYCDAEFNPMVDGIPKLLVKSKVMVCFNCARKLDQFMMDNGVEGGVVSLDGRNKMPPKFALMKEEKVDEKPVD